MKITYGLGALLAVALFGAGCNTAKGSETTGSAAAEPAAAGCSADHLKIEKHKFCIKLGPGWKHDAASERERDGTTEVRFKVEQPPYPSLSVNVHTTVEMVTAETIRGTVGQGGGAVVTSGEFLAGKGHWVLSKSDGGKISTYSVYIKGAGNLVYSCAASGPTPASGTPEGLEQCKTIVPLG